MKYISFCEYIFRLVSREGIDNPEFKHLEKMYGKIRLRELYCQGREKFLVRQKEKQDFKKSQSGDENE